MLKNADLYDLMKLSMRSSPRKGSNGVAVEQYIKEALNHKQNADENQYSPSREFQSPSRVKRTAAKRYDNENSDARSPVKENMIQFSISLKDSPEKTTL